MSFNFTGVRLFRESGAFRETATKAQLRRYDRLRSKGYSHRQAVGITKGFYVEKKMGKKKK